MRRRIEPGLSVRAIRPVLEGLSRLGRDPTPVLREIGLSTEDLGDEERRIPHERVMQLWRSIERLGDDPEAGIHVADAVELDAFDVHAYAFLSSDSYVEGLHRAARYQRLIHDATTLDCRERDDVVAIRHALPGGIPVPRLPAQFLVRLWVRFGETMLGSAWGVPRAVRFAHARPARIDGYVRAFGIALEFDAGENALVIERGVAHLPNPARDARLAAILDRYADGLLDACAPEREAPFSARVERSLATLMDGVPSVPEIARDCHVSVRTLHRRLSAEGSSYREIVDRVRHRRATAMLRRSDAGIAEIAFVLGFSEARAFRTAFRRWTGTTPAAYRSEASAGGAPMGRESR